MAPTITVTAAGETATVIYVNLPQFPGVNYTDLTAKPTIADTVNLGVFSLANITLPAGKTLALHDFIQAGKYSWYGPNVVSLVGASAASKTIIQLDEQSSTQAFQVGPQSGGSNGLTQIRLGGNSSQRLPTTVRNIEFRGTPQPVSANNENQPHNYSGLIMYYSQNGEISNCLFRAAAVGNWNSPPGETFNINLFHDIDTHVFNVEVDGRDIHGSQVGGSPLGCNNSVRPLIENCYFHHSRVSSLTFSYTGSASDATATDSPTTRNVRIEHNANLQMASGKRFSGINHECVIGTINHYSPTISIDWTEWTANHIAVGSSLPSGAAAVLNVYDPIVSGGNAAYNGMLTIQCGATFNGAPNTHKLSNIHVFKNGVELQQILVPKQLTAPLTADSAKYYVVLTA